LSIKEVRWNNGDGEGAGDLILFGKVFNKYQGMLLIIINKRILAAVRFFIGCHIVLGDRWCDDDIQDAPASTDGKC
jgi:hypothetical protein